MGDHAKSFGYTYDVLSHEVAISLPTERKNFCSHNTLLHGGNKRSKKQKERGIGEGLMISTCIISKIILKKHDQISLIRITYSKIQRIAKVNRKQKKRELQK